MRWIRGPLWDGFWFLSGPAFGLLLVFAPVPGGLLFTLLNAHTVSPIMLAWSHPEFRAQVVRTNLPRFVGFPCAILLVGMIAAVATWMLFPRFVPYRIILEQVSLSELEIPVVVWVNIYATWNLYHAGAQNFGFLCLYRRQGFKGTRRWLILAACVCVTVLIGHFLQRWIPLRSMVLFVAGAVFINHWLAAIGIAAHVHGRRFSVSPLIFVGAAVAVGFGIAWSYHIALIWSVRMAVAGLCLRAALGMVHFCYDRWVWRLSDPRVRATIGRELFAHPP